MFGLGMPELIVVMVIALIFFGAGRLPEVGTGLGKAITGFRKALTFQDSPEDKEKKDD